MTTAGPGPARRTVLAALAGGLGTGCTVGPAANRAEQVGRGTGEGPDPAPGARDAAPPASPLPTAAPRTGTALITATLVNGLGADARCLAELPDGSLLIGFREAGTLARVDERGQMSDVGAVQGRLLGLAVEPTADDPALVGVVAYVRGTGSSRVNRYHYRPQRPERLRWGSAANTLISDLPAGGALTFGPDGMLYIGAGRTILRLGPHGHVPPDNPVPGSPIYSAGYADVRGLAWDGDRLWALDGGDELRSVVPGGRSRPVWRAAGRTAVAGLAAARGSLWLPTERALWRLPLRGTELAGAPQPLLAEEYRSPRAVISAAHGNDRLWLLAADAVLRLRVA